MRILQHSSQQFGTEKRVVAYIKAYLEGPLFYFSIDMDGYLMEMKENQVVVPTITERIHISSFLIWEILDLGKFTKSSTILHLLGLAYIQFYLSIFLESHHTRWTRGGNKTSHRER